LFILAEHCHTLGTTVCCYLYTVRESLGPQPNSTSSNSES